ncbi:ATP-binding SpoIIE family protein phosphatase [Streptomyces albidoflavus]|uniref:ATP-binding SpoIIE family protein phosphatase n=1 Tax=Streptomyces albidoflavus TaxID=1886 RepID=UPI0008F48530|nr:SpoIIE family protein phosphatase [Streptomyces albidoflavus]
MRTEDSLPDVRDVLAAVATGLWRWDNARGVVTIDAEAARLLGLPEEAAVLPETVVRARFHPVDWNEINGVVSLALTEGTLAEVRLRVMDGEGRVLRTVRSRSKPERIGPERRDVLLTGTLQEVSEPAAGARAAVTGDWRRSREAFLLDAGRALAEARSTDEVLRVAAGLSMPGFSPDGLAVFGVEGERLTVVGHHGQNNGDEEPFLDMTLETSYPAADVVRTGRAVYLSSPDEYRERYPLTWPLASRFDRQSWAFLPLVAGGRTIGAWMAAFAYRVYFTPDERSVLTTVARMLAQALSRAGDAESARELTDGLQRTMLPTLGPSVAGMSVAARYIPTGGGLQVGGDWYDMIPLPGAAHGEETGGTQRYAFVIGDVQGHDIRAAGLMGQLRIALRAYAAEGHRPDAVLARATRFLSGIMTSRIYGSSGGSNKGEDGALPVDEYADLRFATCLYIEADPSTGVLEVARAGHPDPVIRMPDGTVLLRPTTGGLPLGIDPDADYPITRIVLEPGETIMLCTDGMIETGGHDFATGFDRVRAVMERPGPPAADEADGQLHDPLSGDGLEDLADRLVQAVHGPSSYHRPGPLVDRREDDIAVLLMHRDLHATGGPVTAGRRTVVTIRQDEGERISEARQQLRAVMHDWADEDQVDSAVLLLSELLTNVLVHTDGDGLLAAELLGPPGSRRLRVEVSDPSDDLPHKRAPGELASSGRGLVLLDLLADAWGVDPQGSGKCIWFEMAEHEPGEKGEDAEDAEDAVPELDEAALDRLAEAAENL